MPLRRRQEPSPEDIAKVMRWEQETLSDHISTMAAVGDDAELKSLWEAMRELIFAQSPREVMEVIGANPGLLTDRGDAMLATLEMFAEMVSMPFAPRILGDRREWLTRMREVDAGASGPTLADA
jgi:hypothetical protein